MSAEVSQPSSASTIAAYGFAIAAALEKQGVSSAEIFERCGISLQTTTDPMLRLNNLEISRLFQASVEATANPAFGLLVGESMLPGNLHALGYALLSSTSLRDFAQRLKNYYRIASQSAGIRIEEYPGEFQLIAKIIAANICYETQDAFATLMIRFVRFIYSPNFKPLRVELVRPEPASHCELYRDFFQCDISFGQPEILIVFPSDIVDIQLPGASKELAQMHDQATMQYLKKIDRQDIINRVRTMIVEELSSSAITKQRVADKLCMSSRSLQMKLAAKGTSFQELLDGTRQSLAMGYMERSSISITEAAYLLGFSEVSNFTRAFKRWTGKSPRDFRQSLGLES